MKNKTSEQLLKENEELSIKLQEAEDTLQAIREGAVDALVVSSPQGQQIFTLTGEEQVYRLLVQSMSEAGLTTTPDGRILFCNKQFSTMLGIPMEDIIGKPIEEFISHEDHKKLASLIVGAQIKPARKRIVFKAYDGTLIPSQISANLLQQPNSTSICMVAMDLTEIEAKEQAVRRIDRERQTLQETHNRQILSTDAGGIGTWTFNIDNNELIWDKKCKSIFGLSDETDVTYEQLLDWVYSDDRKSLELTLSSCSKDRKSYDIEYRAMLPDGFVRWFYAKGRGVFDENGKCVSIAGTMTDITERKQAEDQLKREQYYLAKAQEIGSIGTWEIDGATNKIVWTEQNYKNFGVPIGTEITYEIFLNSVHPDDRDYVNSTWLSAVQEKKPIYDIEHRIIADEKVKWIREKAELQFDYNGKFIKATGFAQDITIIKLAEKLRAEFFSRLKSKNEEMEHFLRVLRHDLGNPLLSVQAFSIELAHNSKEVTKLIADPHTHESKIKLAQIVNDDIPSSVAYIQTAVKQMNAILEGLRQVVNIGRLPIDIKDLDMNKLVQTTAEGMKHRLQNADVSLIIEQLPPCLGDANQIQQVFSNLLTNAVKYKEPDRKCQIHISGKIEDDECVYCVEDNGIGMTEDQQGKIFEPFYRVGSVANIEGEGLGLTIVAKILERQEGGIWVESQQGIGSKFFVTLPYKSI